MANSMGTIDDLVTKYLVYRGFHSAAKLVDSDSKNARDKGFRVDKILDQIHVYIANSDLQGLVDYWHFLDRRLFSHLAPPHEGAAHKLKISLLKMYVINAVQSSKPDRVNEFFEKMTPQLQGQAEWSEWFVLPFLKNPEEQRPFAMYFAKQWQDTFFLSLHNFLGSVVHHMPLPSLLNHGEEQKKMARLREENARYRHQLAGVAENKTSTHSGSHEVSTSAPPGGLGSELMDDFLIISQESQPKPEKSQPKSQQLKSFIRNIAMPPSPILGKKPASSTSSVQAAPKQKLPTGDDSSAASRKSGKNSSASEKPAETIPGGTGAQGTCLRNDTARVKFDTNQSASPRHVTQPRSKDTKGVESQHSSNSSSQSVIRLTSAQQTGQSSPRSGGIRVTTDVPSRNSGMPAPFLLLSQDEYVEHHSPVTQCQFCSSGHTVATLDTDGVIKVWSLQPAPVTLVTTMSKTPLISVEWLKKSDTRLLLGSKSCSIRLFDVHEKKTVTEVTTDPIYPRIAHLASDQAGKRFVCSAVGGKLGTVSQPGTNSPQRSLCMGKLTLWDLETMKAEHHLAAGPMDVAINSTSFSEDGRLLLAGTTNGSIRLYDTKRRECVTTWAAHTGDVYAVSFSRHVNSCYSMGSDGQFVEWSIGGGSRIMDHAIHAGACGPFVLSGTGGYRQVHTPKGQLFAFSSDGQHVLTCAQNGGLIYQLQPVLRRVKSLGGHSSPVTCVDWSMSSDYNTCLTGSMDGRVILSTLLTQ